MVSSAHFSFGLQLVTGGAAMSRPWQAHSFASKSHQRTISSSSIWENQRVVSSFRGVCRCDSKMDGGCSHLHQLGILHKGWSEEMPPKSPHQPHSQRLPRIITGLPQCGHRIVAIEHAPFLPLLYRETELLTSLISSASRRYQQRCAPRSEQSGCQGSAGTLC